MRSSIIRSHRSLKVASLLLSLGVAAACGDSESGSGLGGAGGDGGAGDATVSSSTSATASASTSVASSSSSTGTGGGGGGGGCGMQLYALAWNPNDQLEHIVTVDAATGDVASIGQLPDQYMWFSDCAFDPALGRMYQFTSPNIVLTIDAPGGAFVGATTPVPPSPLTGFFMGGVNASGEVLGHAWDPIASLEHVVTLDPVTGTVTSLGALPQQFTLFYGTIYDQPGNRMYTLSGTSVLQSLLRFDGATGTFLGASTISSGPYTNVNLATTNAAGEIIAFAWDPAASLEHVVKIDPVTGIVTSTDTLPPQFTAFSFWNGVFDPGLDRIYIADSAGAPKLFVIEASTGAFLGTTPLSMNGMINPLCFRGMPD